MSFLNLGIVAHVDAGKTSLTERLLYAGGVIDSLGSVDAGSTRTDSLELERRRGITIKTAVASFPLGGVTVNLIDTPGHPDFIAEVERALRVLDGAILVVSAVEGVQAQTRVLMRTLRRLRVPTIVFVNKIDRAGARADGLLRDLVTKLSPRIVPVSTTRDLGTPAATALPTLDGARVVELSGDDQLLTAFVENESSPPYGKILARLSREGDVHAVFFGSAVTGAGVDALIDGLATLLPTAGGDPDGPVAGTVFKVERDAAGARVAYLRMFSGTLRVRDRLPGGTVTAIEGGTTVTPGQIGKAHGLRDVRIGSFPPAADAHLFAPPTLSTVVVPRNPADRHALHTALTELADQDPLIGLRRDDEIAVSLYGEVQKEVIETTLAEQYGIPVTFHGTRTIHIERPASSGHAGSRLGEHFEAALDLRVTPGHGVEFELDVPIEQVPIHVFKTSAFFREALEAAVRHTLLRGPHGWAVTDIRVHVARTGFTSPGTTAADFRKLVPVVLGEALRAAGTVVCEPIHRFRLDGPVETLGATLGALGRFGAAPESSSAGDASAGDASAGDASAGDASAGEFVIRGRIPAARLRDLEQAVPGLTHGEGVLESTFDSYRPLATKI